jgi:hypothetical protein
MIKYVCKPYLANNKDMQTFTTALEAIEYLNDKLAAKEGDTNYVFIAPSKSSIDEALEDYQHIKKLEILWDF